MPPWTDADRSLLLLSIIELLTPTRPTRMPWDEIAERMGAGYTPEAIRQQYNKLRKSGPAGAPARAKAAAVNKTLPQTKRQREKEGLMINRRDDEVGEEEEEGEEDDGGGGGGGGGVVMVNGKRFKVEQVSDDERIIKTERVDEEGVVRLDDDDFYL